MEIIDQRGDVLKYKILWYLLVSLDQENCPPLIEALQGVAASGLFLEGKGQIGGTGKLVTTVNIYIFVQTVDQFCLLLKTMVQIFGL